MANPLIIRQLYVVGRKQHSLEKLAQEQGESLGGTHALGIASKSSLGSQEGIRVN